MHKYLPLIFLSTANVFALDQDCFEKETDAVSPYGICQTFSQTCDIPDDWKVIPSCDLVEDNGHQKLRNKLKDRLNKIRTKQDTQLEKQSARILKKSALGSMRKSIPRPGSANIYQQKRSSSDKVNSRNRRGTTSRNYRSSFSRLTTKTNENKKAKEVEARNQRNAARSKAKSSGILRKSGIRTGKLNTTTKWSYETEQRSRRKDYTKTPIWRSIRSLNAENRVKKEYTYKAPKLSRVYKGRRLMGDLSDDSYFLEKETDKLSDIRKQLQKEDN